MEERLLGATGLRVSAIGLGTLTWGRDTDADDAAAQLRELVEAGGSFVDTAASYGAGDAELVVGSLLGTVVDRDDVVLCTKGGIRRTTGGAVVDASRRSLLDSLDASLARLGTDNVDLFLVQQPDPRTPAVEVAATLAHVVSTGRARYVGLSNHPAWRTVRVADLLAPVPLPAARSSTRCCNGASSARSSRPRPRWEPACSPGPRSAVAS